MKPEILVLGAAIILSQPAPLSAANAQAGRKVAEKHCSRCHVVGDYNPTGGIASTPSFQMLVKRRPDYKERFNTFYARRPHPAFLSIKGRGRLHEDLPPNAHPVEITLDDVANVAAFVETLKPKKK
jgi:mono/diheme cytochrome c family protein